MENEKKERKKKLISRKLETDLKVSGSTGRGRRLSERRGNLAARRRERKRGPPGRLRSSALPDRSNVPTWTPAAVRERRNPHPGWNRVPPFRISGPFPDRAATFPCRGAEGCFFSNFETVRNTFKDELGPRLFFPNTPRGVPRATPGSKKINSRGFAPREKNAKSPDRGRCDRLPDPKGHSFDAAPPGPRARIFLFLVFPKRVEIRQKCTFSPPGETRSFPNKDGTARGIFPEIQNPVDPDVGSTNSKSGGRNSRKFRVPGLPKATSGPAFEKAPRCRQGSENRWGRGPHRVLPEINSGWVPGRRLAIWGPTSPRARIRGQDP
ncbi:hypothetical protein TNCT_329041 [Trichonephila clavata]|uniref:Uncharacterized protein n=1 Tax=Trichonephila clavata TaxID=2740835 RepID=A0A8X6F109_TRICU|nr:hypothetical protein TNCT_329041 [Trichonephila clavata]